MDKFIIVGSGCSAGVPLPNHLFKGIIREKEQKDEGEAPNTPPGSIRRSNTSNLSGSEGPTNSHSDPDADPEIFSPIPIPDLEGMNIWNTDITTLCPTFEKYTRGLLLGFQADTACQCKDILDTNDERSRRNNVSCLLQLKNPETEDEFSNVLVDVGKTFRDACLNVLVPNKVTALDHVLITHAHSDAMGGLDDLREFQTYSMVNVGNSSTRFCIERPLYLTCNEETAVDLKLKYGYCFDTGGKWDVQKNGSIFLPSRWPAYQIQHTEEFTIEKENGDSPSIGYTELAMANERLLETTFLPCYHGREYISMGYGFGKKDKVLYLSDVKAIAKNVMQRICQEDWEILVIDCISPFKFHFSHACLYETLQLIRAINPRVARLVGMTCVFPIAKTDCLLKHWLEALRTQEADDQRGYCGLEENEETRIENIQLGYDGETFNLNLN